MMQESGPRVLLVEDDREIAAEIVADLQDRGYIVTAAEDGGEAMLLAELAVFDLFIVDRMLPSLDGVSLIAGLREKGMTGPVLLISALNSVDDKVRGLKAGGDDYLTKPFALEELAARCEALLRRPLEARETILRAGPLELDLMSRTLRKEGQIVELLPREFTLLEYFMRRPGQVVTRAMLLEDVWHYRFVPQTNLIDVHIGRLRRKIDSSGGPSQIDNIRGTGFVFRIRP
jgi:two-component system OmpR family response regulator